MDPPNIGLSLQDLHNFTICTGNVLMYFTIAIEFQIPSVHSLTSLMEDVSIYELLFKTLISSIWSNEQSID